MQDFYITTPIYYVNAKPHLGHAYTTIVADALARHHKMLGEKTLFLTGTDEHGDKIVQAAEKNGLSPKEFVDEISAHFHKLWPHLDIANDFFRRTTDTAHIAAVQNFLTKVYEAGDIYFGEFGGYYCYGCERFYTEKELEDGLCPQHQKKPEFISEKNYFFRMSKYLPWLKQFLQDNPDLIRPERYMHEAMAMLEGEVLDDLCISRPKSRLSWGIDLPFDKNYVCYVWFDALICYISGIGWPNGEKFSQFWPGEHLIAKDILKPHAIFWPCMLKSAGMPIYRHLNVHGYWLSRDTKMSKSLGNIIEPQAMRDRFGLDAFRYFLLREMNFGSDANFSQDGAVTRINADLANDLGNLFSRTLSMNAKYFDGIAPEADALEDADREIMELCANALANYLQLFPQCRFSQALESLWQFVKALNKYIDTQAPWTLFKENNISRLKTVMAILLAGMRKIAIFLWPAMPGASLAMLGQLGQKTAEIGSGQPPVSDLRAELENYQWLEPGLELARTSNLFPRMEQSSGQNSEDKPSKKQKNDAAKTKKQDNDGTVKIDNFNMLDIRVGTVLEATKHPDADKILVLRIDFAEDEPRQILSGLAEYYKPEDLPGKKVCAIINLAPRKIRGLVSHGMVLTTEDKNGVRVLEAAEATDNGAKIC